jgi:hypothetical protein
MAAMMVASAMPAFAAPGGNGNGCGVGFAVAPAAQSSGGIGNLKKSLGLDNAGNELIQPFHEGVKEVCHA